MTEIKDLDIYIEDLSQAGSKPGLERIQILCRKLSDLYPDQAGFLPDRIPTIHITGTNGKGSVGAFLESIFTEAGWKVGRFSSPAVFEYGEMFRINKESISRHRLQILYNQVEEACRLMMEEGYDHPTLFEVETAAAFLYFYQEGCQIAIIEVGMGGRNDATNMMSRKLAAVFTDISVDHTKFLGNTLTEIAREKAGIIRPGCLVVTSNENPDVLREIRQEAESCQAHFKMVNRCEIHGVEAQMDREGNISQIFNYGEDRTYRIPLAGTFQITNAALAVETIRSLREKHPVRVWPRGEDVKAGLEKTCWPGRLQCIAHGKPYVYVDGCHNPGAARELKKSLDKYFTNKSIISIMGVLADKDYRQILEILGPDLKAVYTVTPPSPRALQAEKLATAAQAYVPKALSCVSMKEAYDKALNQAGPEDVILIFGTLSFLKDAAAAVGDEYDR